LKITIRQLIIWQRGATQRGKSEDCETTYAVAAKQVLVISNSSNNTSCTSTY